MNINYNPHLPNQQLIGIEWVCKCPLCDKEGHFYMNSKSGLWNCKKCGEEGNWFAYQKKIKIGSTNEEEELKRIKKKIKETNILPNILNDNENNKIKFEGLIKEEKKKFIYKIPLTIELPDSFIDISKRKTPEAYDYIIKRRYDKNLIETRDLMYGTVGTYFNRIIIPIYLRGKLKAYLGRWVEIERYKPKKKYRNMYDAPFANLLGDYDLINDVKKPVVICEGSFSAYRIRYNSIYSFGKKLSDEQIYLLKKKNIKDVLLLYDSDAQSEIIKIAEKLLNRNFKVRILLFDEGDPDDLTGENIYERLIDESKFYSPKNTVPIIQLK